MEITPAELKALLDRDEDIVLLDVRTPREWALARLEPAQLIPLHTLPAHLPDLDDLKARRIVTVCHHGVRSLQAASFLHHHGFVDVRSLAGGLDRWSLEIDSAVPRY